MIIFHNKREGCLKSSPPFLCFKDSGHHIFQLADEFFLGNGTDHAVHFFPIFERMMVGMDMMSN